MKMKKMGNPVPPLCGRKAGMSIIKKFKVLTVVVETCSDCPMLKEHRGKRGDPNDVWCLHPKAFSCTQMTMTLYDAEQGVHPKCPLPDIEIRNGKYKSSKVR